MKKVFPYVIEGLFPLSIGESVTDRFNFHIFLDSYFAKTFLQTQLSVDARRVFQRNGSDILSNLGLRNPEPYIFEGDSVLVGQINRGHDGKCIGTNRGATDDLLRLNPSNNFVDYHTSNLDCLADAYACLSLFTTWVDYAQTYCDMVRETKESVSKSS